MRDTSAHRRTVRLNRHSEGNNRREWQHGGQVENINESNYNSAMVSKRTEEGGDERVNISVFGCG